MTLTTIVKYEDKAHEFVTPAEETIAQLANGAVDYFNVDTRRFSEWGLIADGDHLPIDGDVRLDDTALRDRLLKCHALRLVPTEPNV